MLTTLLPASTFTFPRRPTDWPTDSLVGVAPGVDMVQVLLVNAFFLSESGSEDWVLVDAGLPGSAGHIRRAAEERFGAGARPKAIILTHGHFDHVGALQSLADEWDVPIYAHELEMPYLTGRSAYPPPDPTVGGGVMARTAKLFPNHPYDFRPRIQTLPADGSVPEMPGWRWIHTPGHAPGHVSLFREFDRVLVAGDAFITQKQESFWGVVSRHVVIHGPPWYFTPDWPAARESVRRLADLRPRIAATGHGLPISGPRLHAGLAALADRFEDLGMPPRGRYVNEPARMDQRGVVSLPPAVFDPVPIILAGLAVSVVLFASLRLSRQR